MSSYAKHNGQRNELGEHIESISIQIHSMTSQTPAISFIILFKEVTWIHLLLLDLQGLHTSRDIQAEVFYSQHKRHYSFFFTKQSVSLKNSSSSSFSPRMSLEKLHSCSVSHIRRVTRSDNLWKCSLFFKLKQQVSKVSNTEWGGGRDFFLWKE